MSTVDPIPLSDWDNVYSSEDEAKENENEKGGLLGSEQISELLVADFQRHGFKNVPNLSYPFSICFDTDDVLEGVKNDTYDVDSFPMFDRQNDNAYMVDRYDNEGSYVNMNSDFDMHYEDLPFRRHDRSGVFFSYLQGGNEPLAIKNHVFSCVQNTDRNCDQQVEVQSCYEEVFLSNLQDIIVKECLLFQQTSNKDLSNIPNFQRELDYFSF